MTFKIEFEQYEQANVPVFFKDNFGVESEAHPFQSDQNIELQVCLSPDFFPKLNTYTDDLRSYLMKLNIEAPNHPIFLSDNWFLLQVKQSTPSGEIVYHTIWDYLNPFTLTADNIDTEEVAEAISNYFQDWTENNLADLTSEALETAFQDLTQDLETWVSENFTATDAEDLTQLFTDLGQSLENLANADDFTNFPFPKPKLFDVVLHFFTEDDWAYAKIQGEPRLRLAFQGKNGNWSCYAQVNEENQKFAFYSICPSNAPEDKRGAIAEFITRANYGMVIGNFELDYSDGEIRYKTSIDVEGSILNSALIKQLVYTNVLTMDQYLPGILAVIEEEVKPRIAVERVEDGE
ncbi:MAG: YbjN domain-containing protein [Cyanothece sp. SIO2G6]|nr:YbjN domain-containing protein [Cyanothece sp. SIO2G6]